ncbi:hypothetical protein RWA18_12055 [Lacticaseibacillus paracasei]|uniref:hypothetical protein n=1 Tax=Lacticaseibacillus paracasei TaxID=1597 RepID=UPI0029167B5E|nr:hypothetical protein [Lacticaseibacillus paracasei]WNX21765.1 hypothetical protein RWA18_12055 [Lacticaseibacillus paracasei]
MIPAILTTTEGSGNGHTLTGAILIGAVVAVIIILFLVIKLLGAILRHPFISLILFALGGFAIFKRIRHYKILGFMNPWYSRVQLLLIPSKLR